MQEKILNVPVTKVSVNETNVTIAVRDDWAEPAACESGEDTAKQARQQFMAEKREPWRKGRRFK